MNLAQAFLEKLNDPDLPNDFTVDDFYEEMGIPKKNRNDFATAAILKQALEMEEGAYPTLKLAMTYLKQCQKWMNKAKIFSIPGTSQYEALKLAMSKAKRTQKLLKEGIDLYLSMPSK